MMRMDFGCGDGGFLELMPSRLFRDSWLRRYGGHDWVGIDINPEYVEMARSRLNNGSDLIVADGKHLPFIDGAFEFIHNSGALHHMSNYKKGIEEIARVTSSGGSVYIKEVVNNNPFYKIIRRVMGNWRGDDVESFFTSDELVMEMRKYFLVDMKCVRYYWRSIFSDSMAYFQKEPRWSLYYCHLISKILSLLRMDEFLCCHIVVRASRRSDVQRFA